MVVRGWLVCGLLIAALAGAVGAEEASSVRERIEAWARQMPAQLAAAGDLPTPGGVVFRLSGEGGGVWHVRVGRRRAAFGEGDLAEPTAAVECSAADFAAILEGTLDPFYAGMTGRLRVIGDLGYLMEFQSRLEAAGPAQPVTTDTSDWYAFEPLPLDLEARVAPDASGLLDPPAGKRGFLRVEGGRFVFEDGTPARFWGVNIVGGAAFPDHETARRTAARLARFGCNMVRFHHMDAPWAEPNIFDDARDDTQHLCPVSMDRLDYFISELKRHGIYVYLDLLVHRKFRAGDGVRDWEGLPNGAKVAAHYNRRLIELQKQYARELFTHHNPYTGLRYCDDPAIALSQVINESSLFWAGGYGPLPRSYRDELDELYWQWIRHSERGDAPEGPVFDGLRRQEPVVLEFLYETQVAYFTEMLAYLRSIGVKVPLAASNHWEMMALDIKSNLVADFLDRHGYWDHPQGGYGPHVRFNNEPMVKSQRWSLPLMFSLQRAARVPLVISEWNCSWINEYVAEGPLTLAAYAAFHDWSGMLQFDYTGPDWADQITGNFDIGNKPHAFATWPAAARLFLGRHITPGEQRVAHLDPEGIAAGRTLSGLLPQRAGLRHALAFAIPGTGEPARPAELPEAGDPAETDTGEIIWDAGQGLITITSPASAARIGFADGPVSAGPVTFEVGPGFAVVAVTALDDRPIAESSHLLITATARAENTGMVYGPEKRTALEAGGPPILMEPVRGQVSLALGPAELAVEVHALDSVGGRMAPVAAGRGDGRVIVPLEADAFWYEVLVSR